MQYAGVLHHQGWHVWLLLFSNVHQRRGGQFDAEIGGRFAVDPKGCPNYG